MLGSCARKEVAMSKIPPAAWEDPGAFEPDEVREAAKEIEPDDGSFKEIAEEEDDEAVEDPDED
jgi:hypothetical protein